MNINAIPDIPRLYTAIAEWISCLMIVILLKSKINVKRLIPYSAIYLLVLIAFMELTANIILWMWLPCMLVAFISMATFIYVCARTSYRESIYYAMMAFSIAEFIASFEWQIVNYIYKDITNLSFATGLAWLTIIYASLMFIQYWLFSRGVSLDKRRPVNKNDLYVSLFIVLIVFGFSNLRFITDNSSISGQYSREIANARTLIDLAGIAVLYAHYVSSYNSAVLRELEAVQNTLQSQYHQYKQSRESIELINMRYHDMKHQIQFLKSEPDPEKRNEFLDKIEKEIKSFELQNKTGNAVVDTILTGKSLYCYKHGITMTSVVDGKLLDFIDVVDICNIFGNTLDNAIESVMRIDDKEKRLIHVTVSQANGFVMIRVENYYEGTIQTDGDNFLTTKHDKDHHGYGIKSIKYTADRYDGAVFISTDNNWFDIKIAIPIKN